VAAHRLLLPDRAELGDVVRDATEERALPAKRDARIHVEAALWVRAGECS
jgi:hypothetical protein